MNYNHQEVEKKWQSYWLNNKTFACDAWDFDKPKCYVLDMFPYPSGNGLHVGHPEGYTATDIVCRMKRMQGHNVLASNGLGCLWITGRAVCHHNRKSSCRVHKDEYRSFP